MRWMPIRSDFTSGRTCRGGRSTTKSGMRSRPRSKSVAGRSSLVKASEHVSRTHNSAFLRNGKYFTRRPSRYSQDRQIVRPKSGAARHLATDRRGRISYHSGGKRVRKNHAPADHRRIRERGLGRTPDVGGTAGSSASLSTPREYCLSALRALPPPERCAERRIRARGGEAEKRRNIKTGGRGAGHGEDVGLRRGQAFEDQWRAAAADRAGPRAGQPATAAAARRAALGARREPAPPDASGIEIAAARS